MRRWQDNITPALGIPGPVRTCPVCGCTLANSEMGANSHLRMHIRRGEIAREDEQRLRLALLHRPYRSNAAGQGAAKPYPAPACSPLPPCALCGRTEYPVEYGPRQNPLPAGSLVGFDNGERVWICRRCSRDPAALERLETDASLSANIQSGGTPNE